MAPGRPATTGWRRGRTRMRSVHDDIPEGFEPMPFQIGFVKQIGPLYLRRREDRGDLGFRVGEQHLNPAGLCHGGVMMAVMDMAFGFAVMIAAGRQVFAPTINLTHDFLKPGREGDWLESEVNFTHNTPRMGFAQGFLNGPEGAVVRASGLMKLPRDGDARFERKRP